MSWHIVTVKLSTRGRPTHDPANKLTDVCVFSFNCTDSTGEHHSLLVNDTDLEALRATTQLHVTRVELLPDNVIAAIRKSAG